MNKEETISIINSTPADIPRLKNLLSGLNSVDIADIIKKLDREKTIQLFKILPITTASSVFAYIGRDRRQTVIEALTDAEIGEIINRLFVDDAVDFIEEMPTGVADRVLRSIPGEKRDLINQMLQYPVHSAGSIMTTEYVELREGDTVQEAFDTIRKTGIDKETIYTCYVINTDRLLVGVVSAKALMLSQSGQRIADIMDTNLIYAYTTDDREAVADNFRKYSLLAMPVVDRERRLVGIITVDDVVDVIYKEGTEDFEKMGALAPSDVPYLKTGVFRLARNRILWLLALMLSATLTAFVIADFETGLAAFPILMAFVPMLMDTGGNAGSQSSTLIIRGMALGEIKAKDIILVLWKEVRVALLCGLGLGAVNFLRVYIMNGQNLLLCATVTLSLCCTLILAKTVGCVLPIVAKRLKIDPAIMAAPLITTIVDAVSLVIYFSIAKVVLGL